MLILVLSHFVGGLFPNRAAVGLWMHEHLCTGDRQTRFVHNMDRVRFAFDQFYILSDHLIFECFDGTNDGWSVVLTEKFEPDGAAVY